MTINQAPLKTNLIVRSFPNDHGAEISDIESRLMHLGFVFGQTVRVTRKAPLFQEPILVEVRGRAVALTREEAALVRVEVKV